MANSNGSAHTPTRETRLMQFVDQVMAYCYALIVAVSKINFFYVAKNRALNFCSISKKVIDFEPALPYNFNINHGREKP